MTCSRRFVLGGLMSGAALLALPRPGIAQVSRLSAGADTAAIQRAIDAMKARGGGVVELPAGLFRLSNGGRQTPCLTLPAGVGLKGAGMDRTRLVVDDGVFGHAINCPEGEVSIRDLTIDGNYSGRQGMVGHNLRIEGRNIIVDRVRLSNSVTYALALGQRSFVTDVAVTNIEVINAGADGIDLKNRLGRTANVRLQGVKLDGIGTNPAAGRAPEPGRRSRITRAIGKAGIDLRGKCAVSNVDIRGVSEGTTGLRFRPGDKRDVNGPGAHRSRGTNILVRGDGGGTGVMIQADQVTVENSDIEAVGIGLRVGASSVLVRGGRIGRCSGATLATMPLAGRAGGLRLEGMTLDADAGFKLADGEVLFESCRFLSCRGDPQRRLTQFPGARLVKPRFETRC